MKHLKLLLVIVGVMVFTSLPAAANEYDLHQAVLDNDLQLVKRLLSKGAAINNIGSRNYGYGSALHLAVREGHVEIAQVLLERGAQVDVLDPDDFTPLHNAAWNGNVEMAKLLLDAGASMHTSTYDGDTPMSLAMENNRSEVVAFFKAQLLPSVILTKRPKEKAIIDISGTYIAETTWSRNNATHSSGRLAKKVNGELITIKQTGNTITGSDSAKTFKINGTREGKIVKYYIILGSDLVGSWEINADGTHLEGKWFVRGHGYTGTWNLTKIESDAAPIPDITGTYVSSELTKHGHDVGGPLHRKIILLLEQHGNTITGTDSSGKADVRGTLKGDTIEIEFWAPFWSYGAYAVWKVKSDGTQLEGSWTDKHTGHGKWNLTKIESDAAPIPDITGTYIAETTASGSGMNHELRKEIKKLNGKLIVLKQTGNTITGSANSQSDWIPRAGEIKGTRKGNLINFYIIRGNEIIGSWEINADATKLEGKWLTNGAGGASGKWNLKKVK